MHGEYNYKKNNANKANKATNSKKMAKNTAFHGPEQILNAYHIMKSFIKSKSQEQEF